MSIRHKQSSATPAFTIIELLVVIVVIAILAAIVIVAYNGIQKRALASVMQQTVRQAATKMYEAHIATETYPQTLPGSISVPTGVGLALAEVTSEKEFCINVTTPRYDDLQWHINQAQALEEGLCEGAVITASIVGEYNSGPQEEVLASAAVTMNGDGGGFKLTTNESWSEFTLSWDAVEGASRYEIQTRSGSDGTWYLRRISDGASSYATNVINNISSPLASAQIPSTSTSIVWTNNIIKPSSATTPHEYRIRSFDASNVASPWHTLSLLPIAESERTKIENFIATPTANWDAIVLSWDDISHNNVPSPTIEIQTRDGSTGEWYLRRISDGAGSYANNTVNSITSPAATAQIPISTTSLQWTSSSVKPSGSTKPHEYRARLRSGLISNMTSEWVNFILNPPSVSDMNKISNFKVVPNQTWSNVELSWQIGDTSNLPNPTIEIHTRSGTNGTWYLRSISNGAGAYASNVITNISSTGASAQIPPSTTTLTWGGAESRPASSGAVHEYRIRLRSNSMSGVYSDWITFSLTR